MENIEVQDLDSEGHGLKYSTQASFDVCISGERYKELQEIARAQDIDENEALGRIIREGFDI